MKIQKKNWGGGVGGWFGGGGVGGLVRGGGGGGVGAVTKNSSVCVELGRKPRKQVFS